MQIWKNEYQEKCKRGKLQIWKYANWDVYTFGKMQVQKNEILENWKNQT